MQFLAFVIDYFIYRYDSIFKKYNVLQNGWESVPGGHTLQEPLASVRSAWDNRWRGIWIGISANHD